MKFVLIPLRILHCKNLSCPEIWYRMWSLFMAIALSSQLGRLQNEGELINPSKQIDQWIWHANSSIVLQAGEWVFNSITGLHIENFCRTDFSYLLSLLFELSVDSPSCWDLVASWFAEMEKLLPRLEICLSFRVLELDKHSAKRETFLKVCKCSISTSSLPVVGWQSFSFTDSMTFFSVAENIDFRTFLLAENQVLTCAMSHLQTTTPLLESPCF